jgi:hypothetical protein
MPDALIQTDADVLGIVLQGWAGLNVVSRH